jgi:hypothetical protein
MDARAMIGRARAVRPFPTLSVKQRAVLVEVWEIRNGRDAKGRGSGSVTAAELPNRA